MLNYDISLFFVFDIFKTMIFPYFPVYFALIHIWMIIDDHFILFYKFSTYASQQPIFHFHFTIVYTHWKCFFMLNSFTISMWPVVQDLLGRFLSF